MPHTVSPQRPGAADHAAEPEPDRTVDAAAVAQYASTLLPAVLWGLATYVFDGPVPVQLNGAVALLVTGGCTVLVGVLRRRG
jgi:hypothetical protein